MGYVYGKRIYHISEMDWSEDDNRRYEQDKAWEHEDLSLKDRVFHDYLERRQLNRFRKQYEKSLTQRYGRKCAACGSKEKLHIDHKTPVSKGGLTDGENLQFLCQSCNAKKGDMLYYEWLDHLRGKS